MSEHTEATQRQAATAITPAPVLLPFFMPWNLALAYWKSIVYDALEEEELGTMLWDEMASHSGLGIPEVVQWSHSMRDLLCASACAQAELWDAWFRLAQAPFGAGLMLGRRSERP